MKSFCLFAFLFLKSAFSSTVNNNGSSLTKQGLSFQSSGSVTSTFTKKMELIQVQIIHRHGDRTPITPLKNEDYWKNTLPSSPLLSKISEGTNVSRSQSDGSEVAHSARGMGMFGQLTKLGLLQMVEVGSSLRSNLHSDQEEGTNTVDPDGYLQLNSGFLFTKSNPIRPSKVRVMSTDFPRVRRTTGGRSF